MNFTFIPSSTITVVSDDEEDSTSITPSGPILPMISAIKFPMKSSFPEEIEAMAAKKQKKFQYSPLENNLKKICI